MPYLVLVLALLLVGTVQPAAGMEPTAGIDVDKLFREVDFLIKVFQAEEARERRRQREADRRKNHERLMKETEELRQRLRGDDRCHVG